MSTFLKLKRSSTSPTAVPSSLRNGEPAYSYGLGSYPDKVTAAGGSSVNAGGKLFIGQGTEDVNGHAANRDVIGGKYFTDMLDHEHGTLTANSAIVIDQNSKIDVLNVDNLTFDSNTISSTNANGDIILDPAGSGEINIVDDTFLSFGTDKNAKIEYDENGTDQVQVTGADWDFNVNVTIDGNLTLNGNQTFSIDDNTASAFLVQEGTNEYINIDTTDNAELLTLGNNLASVNVVVEDNVTNAFLVKEGTSEYIALDTTNGSELITFSTADVVVDNDLSVNGGDLTTNQTSFNLLNTNATTVNFAGAATSVEIGAATGTTNVNNNLDVDGDVNIDGGDLTVSTATFNLANTTATTVNFAGAGTNIQIGASTGTTNVNNNLDVDGDVNIDGGDLTVSTATFNLANTTATTVNAFGAGTAIDIGATTGTTSINNNLDVDLDLNVDGGDITTNQTSFNLLNTNATTVNAFGAATTVEIGAATGTTNVNNDLDVDGDVNIDGGDLTVSTTTFNLANSTATTVNAFGAAATINMGASGGTMTVANDVVDLDGDLNVDGADITTNQTTFNLLNTNATTVNAFGAATTVNLGTSNTLLDLGHIRIQGDTISTDNTNAQDLVLDPFPDAGDAGGNVVIRGNLQVSGTTTTVNSTEMSVNDPVFTIGDTVSEKTVTTSASSGATDLVIDNPSSIVEGATISGTGIPSNTTISNVRISFHVSQNFSSAPSAGATLYFYDGTSFAEIGTFVSQTASEVTLDLASNISTRGDDFYNGNSLSTVNTGTPISAQLASIQKVNTKVFNSTTITISNATTAGISAEASVTISQASDDNMDRGIQYKYLDGTTSRLGFFGYDESTTTESEKYFTYIPEATNNANVFSGTRGAAWFKTVKLDDGVQNGVAFFDQYNRITRTVAAGTSDVDTSNQILTVDGSGVPVWTTTFDGGTY